MDSVAAAEQRMVRSVPPPSRRIRVHVCASDGAPGAPLSGEAALRASYLIWTAEEAIWLRRTGRLAVVSIGAGTAKASSRGRACALPVALTLEELYVAARNDWIQLLGPVDPAYPSAPAPELDAWQGVLRPAGDASEEHRLRRAVLWDLWERGYRCTPGLKFGVDYLAYVGDPSMVHGEYMIVITRVHTHTHTRVAPLDMITHARIATSSLKVCVIASVLESSDADSLFSRCEVLYAAFRRMGPGSALFTATSSVLDRAAALEATHPAPAGADASSASCAV